jgi:hypothetical protein
MIKTLLVLALSSTQVLGHGFLYFPGAADSSVRGAIRNYNAIDHNIDSLRNPLQGASLCRGAASGPKTPISLSADKDFTVTMAFSVGAQHIGPCSVEILDAKNPSAPGIQIGSVNGCATRPIAAFETDKSGPASRQCPGKLPSGLVTDVSWSQ